MINKKTKPLIISALLLLTTSNSFGFVVFDPTAYIVQALEYKAQIDQYTTQVKDYKTQLKQFKVQNILQELTGNLSDTLNFKNSFLNDLKSIPTNITNVFNDVMGDPNGNDREKGIASRTDKLFGIILGNGQTAIETVTQDLASGLFDRQKFADGIAKSMAATTMIDAKNKKELLKKIEKKSAAARTTSEHQVITNKLAAEQLGATIQQNQLKASDMSDTSEKRAEMTIRRRQTDIGKGMQTLNGLLYTK